MKQALLVAMFLSILGVGAGCASADSGRLQAVAAAASASGMGKAAADSFLARVRGSQDRFFALLAEAAAQAQADPYLLVRVDKSKALPKGYEPADLVALDGTGLSVSRKGHRLRKPAYEALLAMSKAASAEGVTLLVSSTYRSYAYQETVFSRNVAEMGEKEASRVSARPGASQHQLGTAIDFGSITDAFAETKASKWLVANARRFGFSLSYPKGMEAVTGYVWESWHYRYIGAPAAALQAEFFDGAQCHLINFLDAYLPAPPSR